MHESVFQKRTIEHFEQMGFLVGKTKPGPASFGKGFPDTLVLRPDGTAFFVEFKAADGRLSPMQRYWKDKLEAMGHVVEVLRPN